MRGKIRVLVVDDSIFMQTWLSESIGSDPECEIVYVAKDGVEALKAIEELRPDVVTMDIDIPEIDGLTCVAYIMENFPTPIVVVTGFNEYLGDETIRALEYGAVGLIHKPNGARFRDMKKIRSAIISEIKIASKMNVRALTPVAVKEFKKKREKAIPRITHKIVAIAASSGGTRALSHVIPRLPANLTAGVLVCQHMPNQFIPALANRLGSESVLPVSVAEDLEPIRQGKVLVVPAGFHFAIKSEAREGERIRLIPAERKSGKPMPSADEIMTSLAPIYGRNATGVVLTGMGNDGTEGSQAIKKHGGYIIAEDESTCVVNGMPRAVIHAGVVDKTVPLYRIADEIIKRVKG